MKSFDFWKHIIISLIVTPFALATGIVSAGGGHGDYFLAKVLFPYTMLSVVFNSSITDPFLVLSVIQFPVYGLILAFGSLKRKNVRLTIVLAAIHSFAVSLCFILGDENF